MTQCPSYPKTLGRCIALYPGAFRPPHKAHLLAVHYLLEQPFVDEVIVVISNRCRLIPGTSQALDAAIAFQIWTLYLQGLERVRIEVASHNAVDHALNYFSKVTADDTLVFCMGEEDFTQGDDRFQAFTQLSVETGIRAEIISAPTTSLPIRATTLRATLAQGEEGKKEFFAALPSHLSLAQRTKVWKLCRNGRKEMEEILKEKLRAIVHGMNLGAIQDLRCTVPGKIDQVFHIHFTDGRRGFIKYAGDTVGSGTIGQPMKPKPRRRLSAEYQSLEWLTCRYNQTVNIPEIIFFQPSTWTLALTEVCPLGESLHHQFQHHTFDPTIIPKIIGFLAECHSLTGPIPPFWGSAKKDRQHWETILAQRTVDLRGDHVSEQDLSHLQILRQQSLAATKKGFFHLDYQPKNIRIGQGTIGVIDFEFSSSVGDLAYDLGFFLGHYLYWNLILMVGIAGKEPLQSGLEIYREKIGDLWNDLRPRVVGFAGSTILSVLMNESSRLNQNQLNCLAQTGKTLVRWGINSRGEIVQILEKARAGQLA
ncbi:MAG: phosphotransferase [Nitrospirota bacterium]|nr:phosphotransferase [Nitrospirota bacterium]